MNTPQKFFGFLLLPILSFILGFTLSGEMTKDGGLNGKGKTNTIEQSEPSIDIEIFEMALRRWEEVAEPSEKEDVKKFEEAVKEVDALITNSKKLDLDLFYEALHDVEDKYVDPAKIDPAKISEWVIRGMVYSLDDPYSTYMSLEESMEFDEELAGELEGIGAELTMKNGLVTVISPLKDSPAATAGMLPDDVIVKVDGEEIEDLSLNEVVKKIRGPRGSSVTLTLIRKDALDLIELTIVREHIIVESVQYEMKDDVAVIEVNQFGDRTGEEFENYLREAIASGPEGIILDLRFNPGGYLDTAVEMVSLFVKEGKVVVEKERGPDVTNKWVSGNAITDLPLIVLINSGSASASEIVAGALQDHGRAIIIGETSFGKGTVQEILPLSDGSNLKITVAKWLTPNGRDIGEAGIIPDITIEMKLEDYESGNDPQMDAAMKILTGEKEVLEYGDVSENAISVDEHYAL